MALQRLLVILDLDETLIYGAEDIPIDAADFLSGPYRCLIRPHAKELVAECCDRYDVAVWTSASESHANNVIEAVFERPEDICFVWSVGKCTRRHDLETGEIVWLKDLRKVEKAGYSLDRTVAVDDSPEKHARNFGNLVRVTPWTGDREDTELVDLSAYLRWIDTQTSVRTIEKRGWRNLSAWRSGNT